jgi:hypothetical protein
MANGASALSPQQAAARKLPLQMLCDMANAVLDKETGEMLEYRQLLRSPKYNAPWSLSAANEFGRLAQGVGGRVNGTNTIFFISHSEVPKDRRGDATYGRFVCNERPQKEEVNRTRLTVGGNRINYPGEVATPTADLLLVKVMFNSVISTENAKFMTMDIKNFYLNTPLPRFEYVKLKMTDIPTEIVEEYNLKEKVTPDGSVYVEIRRGMYGLPQAGLLAQELLEERLKKHGYSQSKLVHGLWTHKWRPIQFTLVVDDFGVKYVGKEHAEHLLGVLKEHYEVDTDWEGKKYVGITLDWDYERREVHLSMPGYVGKALTQFGHEKPARRQDAPAPYNPPNYGAKQQFADGPDSSPPPLERGEEIHSTCQWKILVFGEGNRQHAARGAEHIGVATSNANGADKGEGEMAARLCRLPGGGRRHVPRQQNDSGGAQRRQLSVREWGSQPRWGALLHDERQQKYGQQRSSSHRCPNNQGGDVVSGGGGAGRAVYQRARGRAHPHDPRGIRASPAAHTSADGQRHGGRRCQREGNPQAHESYGYEVPLATRPLGEPGPVQLFLAARANEQGGLPHEATCTEPSSQREARISHAHVSRQGVSGKIGKGEG